MPKFNRDKINSIFLRVPDLRYIIDQSFRKVPGICPYTIVRGTVNSTEAGYQPQGAEPRDYTDFEQVIDGFDPIVVEWENSIEFPFDGDLNRRFNEGKEVKIRGLEESSFKEKMFPMGSVFTYSIDSGKRDKWGQIIWEEKEYQLPRRYVEKPLLDKESSPYKEWKDAEGTPDMLWIEGDTLYLVDFKTKKDGGKIAYPKLLGTETKQEFMVPRNELIYLSRNNY